MVYFVETLNEILDDNLISVLKFSKLVDIPANTLYNLKKYKPTIENALKIVDYFSSSLDYFERKTDTFKCAFEYKSDFYTCLRSEMRRQNITVVKICKDLNFSTTNFERWSKGMLPTYDNLIRISNYLDCSIDEILGRFYKTD